MLANTSVKQKNEMAAAIAEFELHRFINDELEGVKTPEEFIERFGAFGLNPGENIFAHAYEDGTMEFDCPIMKLPAGTLPSVPHEVLFYLRATFDGKRFMKSFVPLAAINGIDVDLLYVNNDLPRYVTMA